MTWMRLKGIKVATAKGRVYAYHRATMTRLKAAPARIAGKWVATPALLAEIGEIEKAPRASTHPARGTVAAMIWAYRDGPAFTSLKPRTQSDYIDVLDWLRDRAGEESPRTLTPPRARHIRDLAAKTRGFRFGRYVVQVSRVLWTYGVEYGHAAESPWAGITLPKRPQGLPEANRPWTPAEAATVLSRAPIGLRRAYALALMGFRPSDIPPMLWSANAAAGVAPTTIANVSGKTSFDALQSIPAKLAAIFDGPRPAPTIATNTLGRPFPTENALCKASGDFLRGLRKAGVVAPGLTLKGCNHTLGAALAERRVDPRTAKDAMQKKSLQMALHYSRRADTRRNARAAMKQFDAWLTPLGDGLTNSST